MAADNRTAGGKADDGTQPDGKPANARPKGARSHHYSRAAAFEFAAGTSQGDVKPGAVAIDVPWNDDDFARISASVFPLTPGLAKDDDARLATQAKAAQAETTRREAERAEAARIEADKVEAEKLESERVEAERIEAEKAEAARIEAARIRDEEIKVARAEAERAEVARIETARARAEAARAEAEAEAARIEAARMEAERLESAKAEATRVEAAKAEATEEPRFAKPVSATGFLAAPEIGVLENKPQPSPRRVIPLRAPTHTDEPLLTGPVRRSPAANTGRKKSAEGRSGMELRAERPGGAPLYSVRTSHPLRRGLAAAIIIGVGGLVISEQIPGFRPGADEITETWSALQEEGLSAETLSDTLANALAGVPGADGISDDGEPSTVAAPFDATTGKVEAIAPAFKPPVRHILPNARPVSAPPSQQPGERESDAREVATAAPQVAASVLHDEPDTKMASDPLVVEIQIKLTLLGYAPGPADGALREQTHDAIRAFQLDAGLETTGEIDSALITRLRETKRVHWQLSG